MARGGKAFFKISATITGVRSHLHLKLPAHDGQYGGSPWSSKELDPVPVELQTWGGLDYWAYWCSYLLAAPLTATISAVLSLGFTAREVVPIVFCGFLMCSVVVTLTGKIGATYHIPYPVIVRACFGMIGAYPAIVLRGKSTYFVTRAASIPYRDLDIRADGGVLSTALAMIAMVWTSLLCVQGSGMLRNCIVAIWPSFEKFPNHLPESVGTDSASIWAAAELLCFFLWWIVQTLLCLMPKPKLRILFLAKATMVPPAFLALFLWTVIATHGEGIIITGPRKLTTGMGPVYSALMGINVVVGLYSTMAINMPAFGRFSKNRMAGPHQYLALPVIGTLGALTPIFLCNSHELRHGQLEWSMTKIVSAFDSRPAKFFAGMAFMLATIGNQIAAGSTPFSNGLRFADVSSMLPRYINTFRGSLIMAIFCIVSLPWKIVRNPLNFLAFVNAYSCFMGPLAGLLISDYYFVRGQKLDVHELYKRGGIYWYWCGVNWRAFVALVAGSLPLMPGLAKSIAPALYVGGVWKIYTFAWPFGFFVTGLSFWFICTYMSPPLSSLVDKAVLPPHDKDTEQVDMENIPIVAKTEPKKVFGKASLSLKPEPALAVRATAHGLSATGIRELDLV